MKTILACVVSLVFALGAVAQTSATKNAADKKDAKKEEPAKIEGMEIPRGDRGYLGLQIVDATFKLSFYDTKKKPTAANVDRAVLRWTPKYKTGDERIVLERAGDGKALTSSRNVRPPYNFKLFITLLKSAPDGSDAVAESYVVDFAQ
jgi:hypothetical protein